MLTSEERYCDLRQAPAPTILVVEDEVLIRMTLAAMLRDEGFTVIEAFDADEALVALATVPIDVLLTDVRMGGSMDGIELAARAKSSVPDLKVVVVSGHLTPDEARDVADVFVQKPYLAESVVAWVREILTEAGQAHAS